MKNKTNLRPVTLVKTSKQWKTYQQFARLIDQQGQLQTTAQVQQNKPQSAPTQFIQMVF